MDAFDAICHSFATIAIGGFSTHDLSLGYFDNALIELVAVFFMIVAGINFGLHFCVQRKTPFYYLRDSETKAYLLYIIIGAALECGLLWNDNERVTGIVPVLREGIFQTVSMATTTGFSTSNFSEWPSGLPFILLLSAFVGGCAGSTAGGVKVIRVLLLFLQGLREVKRLVHPSGMFPLKLEALLLPDVSASHLELPKCLSDYLYTHGSTIISDQRSRFYYGFFRYWRMP